MFASSRSARTGLGSSSTSDTTSPSAPFRWFEGQIYAFINKKNEESMRRASAWLTEHPEYRADLMDPTGVPGT